ncbi:ABC transporter substrate-binding protein [Bacteroidota bacterium]
MKNRAAALVTFLIILAGCGEKPDDGTVEVVYNSSANATEIQALQRDIPQFASESGVTIKLNPFSGQEKLYAMIAAGQAPDIFYTNATVRDRLAAEGHLLDIGEVSKDDPFLDRLWPQVVKEGISADGGLYSIGNWSFTAGIYYNKDLFDAAGVAYPDTGWTWDDMAGIARALTKDDDGDGKPEQYGLFIASHFIEAFEQMNGTPIQKDALLVSIPDESAEVYGKYLDLMEETIMPDILTVQAMGMQAVQMLTSGKVAMLAEAVPHQGLIEALQIRWGVAPIPRFGTKPPSYFRSGSGGLSINAHTAHPEATWSALKWIIAGATIYQPNPVLNDADFVGGWEERYPQLKGSGFRQVWTRSLAHNGGDLRSFVRYSSWTSANIMTLLQPKFDQLWARKITVQQLRDEVPSINRQVEKSLRDDVTRRHWKPAFRKALEDQLARLPE